MSDIKNVTPFPLMSVESVNPVIATFYQLIIIIVL